MSKALLLLGIVLILLDLYENFWLRRGRKSVDRTSGGHLFNLYGIPIYKGYLGAILVILGLLLR